MTRSKKALALAGALTALALLAIPASASASVWKDKGSNLTKFVELGLTGAEIFETSEGNGMSCEVHATLATEGGSSGEIIEYETEACPEEFAFGSFATCTWTGGEALGLPWEVTVNTSDLTISEWHTKRTFSGCGTSEVEEEIESVTVTLLSPTAIAEMEFAGESESGYKAFGSFEVDSPNSGTLGIG